MKLKALLNNLTGIIPVKHVKIFSALLLSALLLLCPSCKEKNKPGKDILIPEKTLVKILTETYMSDALMNVQSVRDIYLYRDSSNNYDDILRHYGYNMQQMDSTLKYYFTYQPKKLEKIYDQVIGRLSEMDAKLTNMPKTDEKKSKFTNLWNMKPSYSFPEESKTDSVAFSVLITGPGVFRFKADYQVFPDDESIDPQVLIKYSFIYENGTKADLNWQPYKLNKDGKIKTVIIEKPIDFKGKVTLSGFLFYHSNIVKNWKKHAKITNISIEKVSSDPTLVE